MQESSPQRPIEDMVIEDHLEAKAFIKKYKTAKSKDEGLKWYHQFVWEICRHSIGEELVLYPLIKEKVPEGENIVNSSLEDHRLMKLELVKIQELTPHTEEFKKSVDTMWADLSAHLDREEEEDLKQLVRHVSIEDRIEAGKKFENRKLIAPTRPHTEIPDDNTNVETMMSLLAAPYDKFLDLFETFPSREKVEKVKKKATSNLSEVVAEILT